MDSAKPFVAVTFETIAKYGLEAATLLAFITQNINYHERHSKQAWYHSERALAEKLGLGRNRVRRALDRLIEAGELMVEKGAGPNRTDGWRVARDKPQVVPGSPPTKKEENKNVNSKQAYRKMPACSLEKKIESLSSPPTDPRHHEFLASLKDAGIEGGSARSLAACCVEKGVTLAELQWLIVGLQRRQRHPAKSLGAVLRTRLNDNDHLLVREQLAEREQRRAEEKQQQSINWLYKKLMECRQRLLGLMGMWQADAIDDEILQWKRVAGGFQMVINDVIQTVPFNGAFLSNATLAVQQLESRIADVELEKSRQRQARQASQRVGGAIQGCM